MKAFLPWCPRLLCLAAVSLWLAHPAPLAAEGSSSHWHKKPVATDDDDDATPSPTPSPTPKGKTRAKKTGDEAAATPATTATPATKKADSDDLSGKKFADQKPTSADEAAPSKAPDSATTGSPAKNAAAPAAVSSIDPAELEGFDEDPGPVKQLITAALDLTKRNLTYTFGSDNPDNGGMDCSGTIYYLLNKSGFTNVPRQANEQYDWVRSKSHFYAVLSKKQDNFELKEMRPGDLLFWTGTYRVDRDPPVTHTMIYLGKRRSDGKRVMFGASDGRPYNGERRNGVSVFDFQMPAARNGDAADAATTAAPSAAPDFSGYGPIPGMTDLTDMATRQTVAAKAPTSDKKTDDSDDGGNASPSPTPKRKKSRSRND